jgi:hypothetical protein
MSFDEEEESKRRVEYERLVEAAKLKEHDKKLQEENLEKILK